MTMRPKQAEKKRLITKAYRGLARKYPPDKNKAKEADEITKAIIEA